VHWTAVVNPGAGRRGRRGDLNRLRDALVERAVEVRITASAEEGRTVAEAAFERGEGVLACGGDGTVRVLADVAARGGGLLGLVPMGAGNDFARALGIDHRRPLAALDLLERGVEARVDLGRARTADGTEQTFTTVANAGFDSEVNRWANTVSRLSGTTLYIVATLRTIGGYRPTAMRITTDGAAHEGRTWLVAIGNSASYGGGMRITPAAHPADGRFDVVIVGDLPRHRVVIHFPRVLRGTHLAVRGVHHFTGRIVTVSGAPGQDLYASGERIGPLPATVEVLPGALRVLVPADSPALPDGPEGVVTKR
jgi:diacylglycerol kinase (ATP)